jgi:membrane protein
VSTWRSERAERLRSAPGRLEAWAGQQDPASPAGVALRGWSRYRAADGPLQSLLLTLYVLIAVVPALIVMDAYLQRNPAALSSRIAQHYRLSAATADVLRGVLSTERRHELGSALFAIAGALFFGLGFGRVLQLVHVRAWQLDLRRGIGDQARYAAVLLGLYGLILVLLVQMTELADGPGWTRLTISPGWVVLLFAFFLWSARLLTHGLVPVRDLLPGAALTALALVALMIVSSYVMNLWVDLYARDYGGFGVVMAVFFWLGLSSTAAVGAAILNPVLADRRRARYVVAASR